MTNPTTKQKTTNPPTETAKEPNYNHGAIGKMLNGDLYYEGIRYTPTKVEPTVEKWDIEKKFYEDLADNEWILDDPYSPDMVQMPFHELEKRVHVLLSHSLAEARREWVEEMRGLKKPDNDCRHSPEDSCDSNCTYQNEHKIYNQAIDDVVDLLTGDNPERKV